MSFKNLLSASCLVGELSSPRLDWLRVGLSANSPVTWLPRPVYGHFGPKTLRTQDISALVPKSQRSVHWTFRHHRKNPRYFGTSAEMSSAEVSWTFWHHFVHRSVTIIYLFKKDHFIDDLWHIFRYFLYTTSLNFFVLGNQHTTNRVRIAIVISWWRKRKQFHQSEWFHFLFCRIVYH